jgi:hypothetical protein
MRKSKFLALALVVAVMLTGAGYAATMKASIPIGNQITAGYVDAQICDTPTAKLVSVYNDDAQAYGTRTYNHETLNDIAMAASLVKNGTITDNARDHVLSVTPSADKRSATVVVNNAYDGMLIHVAIPFQNTGSIPLISKLDPADPACLHYDGNDTSGGKVETECLKVVDYNLLSNIINPDQKGLIEYDIEVNNVDESGYYSFTVTPLFQQYNMKF